MNDHVTVPRAALNMIAGFLCSYANELQGDHRDTCGCTSCEVATDLRDINQALREIAAKETTNAS